MKANGFLSLIFKHVASHLCEKAFATHCTVPLSLLHTPVENIFIVSFVWGFFVSTYKFLSLLFELLLMKIDIFFGSSLDN